MNFTKENVLKWMRINKQDFIDSSTNELNFTTITEAAADHFDQSFVDGPLDDETHWIWECALEIKT